MSAKIFVVLAFLAIIAMTLAGEEEQLKDQKTEQLESAEGRYYGGYGTKLFNPDSWLN